MELIGYNSNRGLSIRYWQVEASPKEQQWLPKADSAVLSSYERGDNLDGILIIVYIIAAWWAYGVVFENYIRVGTFSNLFLSKLIVSALAGIILIPIAIIKKMIRR